MPPMDDKAIDGMTSLLDDYCQNLLIYVDNFADKIKNSVKINSGSGLSRELQNAYFSTGVRAQILDLLEICGQLEIPPTDGLLGLCRTLDGDGPSQGGRRFRRDAEGKSAWSDYSKAVRIWTDRREDGKPISVPELAKLLNIKPSTLRGWMRRDEWARDAENRTDARKGRSLQLYAGLRRTPKR